MRSLFRKRSSGARAMCLAVLAVLAQTVSAQSADWLGAWATSQSDAVNGFRVKDQTLREVVTVSTQGQALRVRLNNRFGRGPVTLDEVQIGLSEQGGGVVSGTSHRLLFNGHGAVTLAPGASVMSDPVAMPVQAMQRLAISLYTAGEIKSWSRHASASEYLLVASGNQSQAQGGQAFARVSGAMASSWALVDEVDVQPHTPTPTRVLVTFGDSITEGALGSALPMVVQTVTFGQDQRYPDYLARRMVAANKPVAVVNAGIGGNRLLSAGLQPLYGPSGLSRLQRDVLGVSGVTDALILIGTNDLGMGYPPRAGDLIAGLSSAVTQLKRAGVRVIVGTITPTLGPAVNPFAMDSLSGLFFKFLHGRASVDVARQQVNSWIRSSGVPDAVVDFDACVRNPSKPSSLRTEFDSGDHLHPNAKGYEAMAACVDLGLFN